MSVQFVLYSAHWDSENHVSRSAVLAQQVIPTDRALGIVAHMFANLANVGVTITELTEGRIILAYEYDISGLEKPNGGPDYGFAYAFSYVQGTDPWTLPQIVFALGTAHRKTCSREVAEFIATTNRESHDARVAGMEEALRYYADRDLWDGTCLGGPWRESEGGAHPSTPAFNATHGFYIRPFEESEEAAKAKHSCLM
jgi:hypothetical protein